MCVYMYVCVHVCVCMCVCILSYPACKPHAPYCLICGLSRCTIFSTLSHKRYDYQKQVMEYKTRELIFLQLSCETLIILRRFQRDIIRYGGTAVAQWLRCCATKRKVAGSIPAGVIDIKSF